ncbi:MAG: hypothetical protein R2759_20615 [Bacteroidales bacterium]
MKNIRKSIVTPIACLALTFLFLISCEDDGPGSQNTPIKMFTGYPSDSGNYWKYDQLFTFAFDPDTVQVEPDSGFNNIHVSVTGHVMMDTLNTIEFSEYDYSGKYFAKSYFKQHTDGFYIHAYMGGSHAIPTKSNYLYKLGALTFESQEALMESVAGKVSPTLVKDSLFYEDPPVKCWNYPISISTEWVYRENGPIGKMTRKVVGINTVETPAGLFQCYKIKMVYHDTTFANIIYHDYLSEIGLVKRTLEVENVVMMDAEGNEIGVGKSSNITELTQYSVVK